MDFRWAELWHTKWISRRVVVQVFKGWFSREVAQDFTGGKKHLYISPFQKKIVRAFIQELWYKWYNDICMFLHKQVLPVWGSYSFQRVACLDRMICCCLWAGSGRPGLFMLLGWSPTCLPSCCIFTSVWGLQCYNSLLHLAAWCLGLEDVWRDILHTP